MSYDTAIIECTKQNGEVFPVSHRGDIVFYPLNKTQSILIGTERGTTPCLKIKNNRLGLNTGNPRALLHVAGNTQLDGNVNVTQNIQCHDMGIQFQQRNKMQGNIKTFKNKHGTYFNTLADSSFLMKNGTISPATALEKINSCDVNFLKKKDETEMGYNQNVLGCLANDIHPIYPACISDFEANNYQIQTIDYSKLVPLLIQSIKGLTQRIVDLENKQV